MRALFYRATPCKRGIRASAELLSLTHTLIAASQCYMEALAPEISLLFPHNVIQKSGLRCFRALSSHVSFFQPNAMTLGAQIRLELWSIDRKETTVLQQFRGLSLVTVLQN